MPGLLHTCQAEWVIAPVDLTGAPTEQYFDMRFYHYATFFISLGDNTGGSAVTIDVQTAATEGGAGTDLDVIKEWFSKSHASALITDDQGQWTRNVQTADARITATNNAEQFIAFEIDGASMPSASRWLTLVIGAAGATKLGHGLAIFSGGRYQGNRRTTVAAGASETANMPEAV